MLESRTKLDVMVCSVQMDKRRDVVRSLIRKIVGNMA